MAARPARQFSPISNTTVHYRRGEYADSVGANDNDSDYINDNNDPGPLTDIASGFNQQSYQQQYVRQPQNVGTTLKRAGTAAQVGGKSAVATGRVAQVGGRTMQRGGGAMMRAGVALSSTGVGAVVGAPLAFAGGVTAAAGTGLNAAGKTSVTMGKRVDRSGRMARQLGKAANDNEPRRRRSSTQRIADLRNIAKLRKKVKGHVSATRVNMTALSSGGSLWFSVQLPLALTAIVVLGIAAVGEAVAEDIMEIPFIGWVISLGIDVIDWITGVNILESWVGFNQVVFGGLTMLVFLIGMFTLFMMAGMYTFSGVRCFFGEHPGLKMGTFIFALLGYLMPILNIFPWFILWGIVVWRYPK